MLLVAEKHSVNNGYTLQRKVLPRDVPQVHAVLVKSAGVTTKHEYSGRNFFTDDLLLKPIAENSSS